MNKVSRGRLTLTAAMLLACAFAFGCDDGPTTSTDGGPDSQTDGRPDTGTSGPCGGEREPCCNGSRCDNGLTCSAGSCTGRQACGSEGQQCCDGVSCEGDLVCQERRCVAREECGSQGQPCCTGGNCSSGLVCEREMCSEPGSCGAERQPCCEDNRCATGLTCDDGTCATAPACGGARQPCCSDQTCNDGLECQENVCQTNTQACGAQSQACCEGNTCSTRDLTCCFGTCVDTSTDARNCNGCGELCRGTCSGGRCGGECGADGQPCCRGETPCVTGLTCNGGVCGGGSGCGVARTTCANADACCEGLSCRLAPEEMSCCAEAGTSCSATADCCGLMQCGDNGRCLCRSGSQTCTVNEDCCAGLACEDGVCTTEVDPCEDQTTCATCLSFGDCGWCDSTDTCMVGTFGGPAQGTCSDWDWFAMACDNTDICASLTSCESCLDRTGCGWCGAESECMTGSETGPSDGTCETWQWLRATCGTDPCNEISDCESCAAAGGCGYCDSSDTCMTGSFGGPASGECDEWDWYSFACDNTDACNSSSTCEECVARTECGWCASTGNCVTGSDSAPAEGSCNDWKPDTAACAIDSCSENADCASCTDVFTCGWCESTSSCHTGGSGGPDTGFCADWDWSNGDCTIVVDCSPYNDCHDCLDESACGWCDSTDTCMQGSFGGPDEGTCDDWDWLSAACDNTDTCSTSEGCEDCLSRSTCGYCTDTEECLTGTGSGPDEGTCDTWQWLPTECGSDPCNNADNCGDCLDMEGCGWCDSTDTCVSGAFGGPTEGTCDEWDWYSWACDNTDACETWGTCESCVAQPECGWCAADELCKSGASGGPTEGQCDTWQFGDCTVDPCNATTDCGDCLDLDGCGWCDSTDTCMSGDSGAPHEGTCEDWDWWSLACDNTDICEQWDRCTTCTDQMSCGWCVSNNTCYSGNSQGPLDESCDEWDWLGDRC